MRSYPDEFDFTEDWFSNNIPIWNDVLEEFKDKPIRALEIGSYEGRSAIWLIRNILTNPESRLTLVDPWPKNLVSNIEKLEPNEIDRVNFIRGYSREELPKFESQSFDLIYIDGSHASYSVITDAVNSVRLIKPGGIIIFDDYEYKYKTPQPTGVYPPKPAIDFFIKHFQRFFYVKHVGYQCIVRRNEVPL